MKIESKFAKKFLAGILSVALVALLVPMAFAEDDAETALDVINDVAALEGVETEEVVAEEVVASEEEWNAPANYTNVAPFGDPAIGDSPKVAMFSTRGASAGLNALAENAKDGLVTDKAVSEPDSDGEYTLTLESYATGAKVTTAVTESVPTDIVLVLDQSGSMSNSFGYSYREAYPKSSTYGTYYAYVDGSPVRVYYCSECGGWFTQEHSWWNGHSGVNLGMHKTSSTDTASEHIQLYTRGDSVSRLEALETAASNFINQVYTKSIGLDGERGTSDDVDHRIAVVGFASTLSRGSYNNTEILSTSNVINYVSATDANYQDALVSVQGTNGVNTRLTNAINRLDNSGDTYSEYGLDMANKVFANNALADGEKRNRVVIMFTDGYTAPSGTDNIDYSMSDRAIANAKILKDTYTASVYTIGIFSDANPASDITSNFQYGSTNAAQQLVAANRYMHYCSSNYPNAESLRSGGTMSSTVDPFNGGDSYYLTAADADSLNTIFDEISKEIESGGSSITLNESAVVKDVIASSFALPDGVTEDDIKVYTADYIAENTFAEKEAFDAAQIVLDEGKRTVSVSNFDFAENWVGTETDADGNVTYRGKKLIIEIPIVVREGFLGGNNVPTNGEASGVYENDSAESAVEAFPIPDVDVDIEPIKVIAADKNVYLLGSLTSEQLLEGAQVECGDAIATYIDGEFNFEPWQDAYVTIDVPEYAASDYANLTADKTFELTCEIAPTDTDGSATAQSANTTGNAYVYKPVLTYADQKAWYGGEAPSADSLGPVGQIAWKHGNQDASNMIGKAPTVNQQCTIADGAVSNGLIATPEDIPVSATVKIGDVDVTEFVTFAHIACESDCSWNETTLDGNPAFLLHPQTCTLTINKDVKGVIEPNQSFLFDVMGTEGLLKGKAAGRVSIQGEGQVTITNLPVGTYEVTEDTGWSWRYTTADATESVVLSADANNGEVTITNTREDNNWLGGEANAINNFVNGVINATNNGKVQGSSSSSDSE